MTDTVETVFGGLVVGSTDPGRLSAWYRVAFAPDTEPGDILGRAVIVVGGSRLVFDKRSDISAKTTEPGRVQINLFVTDIKAVEEHLNTLDVEWVRPVETITGFGSIGTFADPDGNYVQVLHRAA
ncbi:MAG TPA: VOC family protein [Pseudonocardiaceae bacterium]